MMLIMMTLSRQFKIFRSIVMLVAILMMCFLVWGKASSKHLCHDQSVFKDTPSFISHSKERVIRQNYYANISSAAHLSSTLPIRMSFTNIIPLFRSNFACTRGATCSLWLTIFKHNPLLMSAIRTSTPNMLMVVFKSYFSSSFNITSISHGLIISHSGGNVNA